MDATTVIAVLVTSLVSPVTLAFLTNRSQRAQKKLDWRKWSDYSPMESAGIAQYRIFADVQSKGKQTMLRQLIIAIALAVTATAGTITINTTTEQDVRIQAAFRSILGLDHNPSSAEVRQALVDWLRNSVLDYERRQNMQQFNPTPFGTPSG